MQAQYIYNGVTYLGNYEGLLYQGVFKKNKNTYVAVADTYVERGSWGKSISSSLPFPFPFPFSLNVILKVLYVHVDR